MAMVTICRVAKQTRLFNKGQKVFLVMKTGAGVWKVRGKYRGFSRPVVSWAEVMDAKEIEVEDSFAERAGLLCR